MKSIIVLAAILCCWYTVNAKTRENGPDDAELLCYKDAHCPQKLYCVNNKCMQLLGAEVTIPDNDKRCTKDIECHAYAICMDGFCRDTGICRKDADCAEPNICYDRVCSDPRIDLERCLSDDHCEPNKVCKHHRCVRESETRFHFWDRYQLRY